MLTSLVLVVVLLALAQPVVFYCGLRAGRHEASAVQALARDAMETLKASSLSEKVAAQAQRAESDMLRQQMERTLSAPARSRRAPDATELEVYGLDGAPRTVRAENLEPLSPLEMRNLEQIT